MTRREQPAAAELLLRAEAQRRATTTSRPATGRSSRPTSRCPAAPDRALSRRSSTTRATTRRSRARPLGGLRLALRSACPSSATRRTTRARSSPALMGYATVGVNMRGTGCSGGAYDYFEELQLLDGYDVIETVAAQDWVVGHRVGMTGLSYPGITQLFVARTHPPSLAAITPLSVIGNTYTTGEARAASSTTASPSSGSPRCSTRRRPTARAGSRARVDAGDKVCEENQLLHGQKVDVVQEAQGQRPTTRDALAGPLNPTAFVHEIDVPVFLAGSFQDEQTGPVLLHAARPVHVVAAHALHRLQRRAPGRLRAAGRSSSGRRSSTSTSPTRSRSIEPQAVADLAPALFRAVLPGPDRTSRRTASPSTRPGRTRRPRTRPSSPSARIFEDGGGDAPRRARAAPSRCTSTRGRRPTRAASASTSTPTARSSTPRADRRLRRRRASSSTRPPATAASSRPAATCGTRSPTTTGEPPAPGYDVVFDSAPLDERPGDARHRERRPLGPLARRRRRPRGEPHRDAARRAGALRAERLAARQPPQARARTRPTLWPEHTYTQEDEALLVPGAVDAGARRHLRLRPRLPRRLAHPHHRSTRPATAAPPGSSPTRPSRARSRYDIAHSVDVPVERRAPRARTASPPPRRSPPAPRSARSSAARTCRTRTRPRQSSAGGQGFGMSYTWQTRKSPERLRASPAASVTWAV